MSISAPMRPCIRRLIQSQQAHQPPPSYLNPPLANFHTSTSSSRFIQQQISSFSSTSSSRYPRDMNRQRGVSSQRRTGLRQPLSVSKTPLPKPVLDASQRFKYQVDKDHGLWGFFHSRNKAANTPEEDYAHGRSWTPEELRAKSWEDLHALWWVCCKERNCIATETYERHRLEAGYGDAESQQRDKTVRTTQRAIKQVLTERWYSWREAQQLAKTDPEVNLSERGAIYQPTEFFDEILEQEGDVTVETGAAPPSEVQDGAVDRDTPAEPKFKPVKGPSLSP